MSKQFSFKNKYLLIFFTLLGAVSLLFGCSGDSGSPGKSTGTISGTVTTSNSVPLEGVTVSTSPDSGTATTAADGTYSMTLSAGSYALSYALANYTDGTASANVAVGITTTVNVTMAMAASGKPTVTVSTDKQNVGYNGTANLTATATSPFGYSLTYTWSGASGSDNTATATTPDLATAMAGTAAPSSDAGGYVSPYAQENRFGVLPISADTRGAKSVSVTVDDGHGGSTKASVTINAASIQPGTRTVALGVPVYLNSGHDDPNNWVFTPASGSSATIQNSASRNPYFIPDVVGKYTVGEGTNTMDIYAGKWVGAISGGTEDASGNPSVTPDSGCLICHDDVTAPDKFTPWKATGHATFFASGLNGITSNSGTCANCHTEGFDNSLVATSNDGYGDTKNLETWSYPSTKQKGNWTAMWTDAPKTARRTNIQCESCHGPNDSGTPSAHGTGLSDNPRVSYSSEVCAQCHASGTGHHIYSEWNTVNPDTNKGHSKIAQLDATGYTGHAGSTDPSCSRCHTAQGFAAYATQLATGNSGPLTSAITWTKNNAQPQTCTACHDPHDKTNPNQLRVYDSVQMTMAGFGITGLGKGAICLTCHNIRNGNQCASGKTVFGKCTTYAQTTFLHEDGDAYADTWLDKPHDASQAEVLMGRNAFFMQGFLPMISKHVNVEDSCVGCHMKLNPQTHLSHGTPEANTHQWYITDADAGKLCANCHSSNVGPEALKAQVESLIETAGEKLSAELKTELLAAQTAGKTVYIKGTAVAINAGTTITWAGEGTFNIGTTSGSLSDITSDAAKKINIIDPAGNLRKGVWNVYLIELDGSYGVHNPSFIIGVLNKTISKF